MNAPTTSKILKKSTKSVKKLKEKNAQKSFLFLRVRRRPELTAVYRKYHRPEGPVSLQSGGKYFLIIDQS